VLYNPFETRITVKKRGGAKTMMEEVESPRIARPVTQPTSIPLVAAPSDPDSEFFSETFQPPRPAVDTRRRFHSDEYTYAVESLTTVNFAEKLVVAKRLADAALQGFLWDLKKYRSSHALSSETDAFLRDVRDVARSILSTNAPTLWCASACFCCRCAKQQQLT
jgi:hypothetical protein